MNKDGYWKADELEPLSGRLRRLAGDPDAYAVRLDGDSLEPRYQSGDYVMVRPSAPLEPDKPVYVVFKCGYATIRYLSRQGPEAVVLRSVTDGSRITVTPADVVLMHRVTGQADSIEFLPD